jgi:hypothetical protein
MPKLCETNNTNSDYARIAQEALRRSKRLLFENEKLKQKSQQFKEYLEKELKKE